MIAPSSDSLCKQAELYYYDFLFNESYEPIPEFIINHINKCQHCQQQLNQLKGVLSQAESQVEPEKMQVSSAITEMLKLHFAYIGKPVACETVRPFLPSLLEPALEVRIPTPITAHLDNCRRCSEDLETIQRLNLSRKQLRRLSQLFADKPGEDNVSCSQAQAAILAVVSMAFRETNKEVLKHLCTCPNCRRVLYQYRDNFRAELLNAGRTQEGFLCEQLSSADIFDYVMPYGLDPANDQYAKFRQYLTSHMRTCPRCLAKMQHLHDTVFGIAERPESEVITVYHIDESAKAEAISESNGLYAGFPIRIEIASRKDEVKAEQPVPAIDFAAGLKRKISAKKLKPLLKPAIAAAAVILIGFALFLSMPTAKAVTLQRIYEAIEKVKNVHISKFVPDQTEPAQEEWVSRALNIYMTKTGEQWVLWDLANGLRKSKQVDSTVTEATQLSADSIAGIERKMSSSLGLIPFYDISDIPADAEWGHVDKARLEVDESIEAYDLIWIGRKHINLVIFNKWRIFVDSETKLPQRTEFYQKVSDDIEYTLYSAKVVEYLSESEMQEVIKEASF
ncbi:MAG: hypothetical protein DRP62_02265 [Planctomycetota bacterium]|nr:MAG: hypothetical protein DRP62_02265 [Planctomycetota bacterium]